MLYVVYCVLYVVCYMLCVVWCVLYGVCYMVRVVCYVLYVVCCMLYVMCCVLCVVCCVLCVAGIQSYLHYILIMTSCCWILQSRVAAFRRQALSMKSWTD